MPKPVKKLSKKTATPKPPSGDPKLRARQAEPAEKAETGPKPPQFEPDDDADTRMIISAYMKVLGTKGGKVSGAKRMDMPMRQRKAIAKNAAAVRWAKKDGPA
jgi:hypothetical protein